MTESDLIQGSSVKCRTMADGTFRLEIDIEPSQAMQAFGLFGQPGAPVVLARLTQAAAQASMQKQAAEPEQKGGELAKWAGILCADEYFWAWLVDTYSYIAMMHGESMEESAKQYVYETCGIQSRRELDHNKEAGRIFRESIMKPFHQWREGQK